MFPTLIEIWGVRLATYGVLVAAGYLAGILWLQRRHKEMGFKEDDFWNLVYALFFGAIAGGKLLYWAVEWRAILSGELRPLRDFRFGFVFFGGFLGSIAAGWLFRRKVPGPFFKPADYFGVALPMGHAIGRLGCLAAGCCSGRPTDLPWGIRFTRPDSLVPQELLGLKLHPTQLYESLADVVILLLARRVLSAVQAGRAPEGAAFLTYIAGYSTLRFAIEFLRGDAARGVLLGFSTSQWIALGFLACAAAAWARLCRRGG